MKQHKHKQTLKAKRLRFFRCQKGVTALEFAMISPAVLLMLMGTVEVGLMMYVSGAMESATANSSRLGKTGFVPGGSSREQAILTMIENRTGGLVDMENVTVETTVYPSFDTVGQAEPYEDANANGAYDDGEDYDDINGNGERDADMGESGLGDANDVVVYNVSYDWPISTPIVGYFMDNSSYTISTRTVVKNEPYNVE